MKMYCIQTTVETRDPTAKTSLVRQVPTFYLHPEIQGIDNLAQACRIAAEIMFPNGTPENTEAKIHAEEVGLLPPPGRN